MISKARSKKKKKKKKKKEKKKKKKDFVVSIDVVVELFYIII
jgi:hypothetical protein